MNTKNTKITIPIPKIIEQTGVDRRGKGKRLERVEPKSDTKVDRTETKLDATFDQAAKNRRQ